jgi:hypothetical protein
MLPLQVDPRDRKRIVLGAAAIAKGNGIPDRDPGRQADVLRSRRTWRQAIRGIWSAPLRPRCDGVDVASLALLKPRAVIETVAIQ